MKQILEILSKCTSIPVNELEFKNEVQIIRPSEAIEAMQEIYDYKLSLNRERVIEVLNKYSITGLRLMQGFYRKGCKVIDPMDYHKIASELTNESDPRDLISEDAGVFYIGEPDDPESDIPKVI